MAKTKVLTCDKCKRSIDVGIFSKNDKACECGGLLSLSKKAMPTPIHIDELPQTVMLKEASQPVVLPVPAPIDAQFTENQRIKVMPHTFDVGGIKCAEVGFNGIFIKEMSEKVVRVRKDKNGTYDICKQHVKGL